MQHYTVLLDNFEGPLDLLLQLVEREQLDVRDVSLSQVTSSYLEHLRAVELRPAEVSQFVTIATQLVLTKSKRVLPTQEAELDEHEEDLSERLERYQLYRTRAARLAELRSNPYLLRPLKARSLNAQQRPFDLSVTKLRQVWQQLKIANQQQTEPKHRVKLKRASLESVLVRIIESLSDVRQLSLARLMELAPNPHEAVLSFLAVLELAKQNRAEIELADDNVIIIRSLPKQAMI